MKGQVFVGIPTTVRAVQVGSWQTIPKLKYNVRTNKFLDKLYKTLPKNLVTSEENFGNASLGIYSMLLSYDSGIKNR